MRREEEEPKRISKRTSKAYPDVFIGTQIDSKVVGPSNRKWTVGTRGENYRYHFIKDRKVVHRGITNDLQRREQEHKREHGSGHIVKIGRSKIVDIDNTRGRR